MPVLHAQDGMVVLGAVVGLAAGNADADHRRLAEIGAVGVRFQKVLEQFAVKITEAFRNAEGRLSLVAGRQYHAEIVVTHIGREVVADDALGASAGTRVDNGRAQHLDQRERIAAIGSIDVHLHRDDVQLNGVAVRARVVPVRQVVEAVVDHADRVAQVFLAGCATGQVGEVGGDARAVSGLVVLVEGDARDAESEGVGRHGRRSGLRG